MNLQVPMLGSFGSLFDHQFFRPIFAAGAFKFLARAVFSIRTWLRRTIWGDRVSAFYAIFSHSLTKLASFSCLSEDLPLFWYSQAGPI